MSDSFAIRRAHAADISEIAELHVRTWRSTYGTYAPKVAYERLDRAHRIDHWTGLLAKDPTTAISLVTEAAPPGTAIDPKLTGVGYACLTTREEWPGTGEIVHLYIDPNAQSSGLGSALFAELASFLWALNVESIRLSVVKENRRAIDFYERRGGTCVSELVEGVLWRSENLIYEWRRDSSPT